MKVTEAEASPQHPSHRLRRIPIATDWTPRLLLLAAIAVSAGIPNLLQFDRSGLTRSFGTINLSSIWRMLVFVIVVGALLLVLFAKPRVFPGRKPSMTGLRLMLFFFGWITVTTILSVTTSEYLAGSIYDRFEATAVPLYRIFEWVVVLAITWRLIPAEGDRALERFAALARMVSLSAVMVLAGILVVKPDLAYIESSYTGTFRLGGTAFGSNHLAVVVGVGALYWFGTGRNIFRFPLAFLMAICCVLTASRSGIIGFAVATVLYSLLRGGLGTRACLSIVVGAILIFVGPDLGDHLYSLIARGENERVVSSLNNRTLVWQAAIELVKLSPAVGHGFIVGPKLLQTHFALPFWAPPHAHNDILNAAVAGGLPAAALLLLIYLRNGIDSWRVRNCAPILAVTFIPLVTSTMVETSISGPIIVSTIISVCFIRTVAIVASGANSRARNERRTQAGLQMIVAKHEIHGRSRRLRRLHRFIKRESPMDQQPLRWQNTDML